MRTGPALLALALLLGGCSAGPGGGDPGEPDAGAADASPAVDAPSADAPSNDASDGGDAGSACLTCASAGVTCGTIPDGCGGLLTCGACATFYIGPQGDDGNAGTTRAAPWRTFGHALPKLTPGATLVLLDGTYSAATTGLPTLTCGTGGTTHSGTASMPVTLVADHYRKASIESDRVTGSTAGTVLVSSCSHLNVIGLRARADDAVRTTNRDASVFQVSHSDHILFYRDYGEYNNRLYNTQVFSIDYSSDCSAIECEAYNYHRHGFDAFDPSAYRNVFQRDYANATAAATCLAHGTSDLSGGVHCGWDLVCDDAHLCGGIAGTNDTAAGLSVSCASAAPGTRCGHPSHNANLGDEGFTQYWSRDGFVENCISVNGEGQQATGQGNVLAGGVSIDDVVGVSLSRNQSGEGSESSVGEGGNLAHDMVVVRPRADGLFFCGAKDDSARNVTIALPKTNGFIAVGHLPNPDGGLAWCQPWQSGLPMTFSATDVAVLDPLGPGAGALVLGTFDTPPVADAFDVWLTPDPSAPASRSAYGTSFTTAPSPSTSASTAAVTGGFDPVTGKGPIVFVPAGSSLHGAGQGGADVGANATCLYDHGQKTSRPMWTAATGVFAGCAWYAAGSADDVAASEGYAARCSNVHESLNVGTNGGPIPSCVGE